MRAFFKALLEALGRGAVPQHEHAGCTSEEPAGPYVDVTDVAVPAGGGFAVVHAVEE